MAIERALLPGPWPNVYGEGVCYAKLWHSARPHTRQDIIFAYHLLGRENSTALL